MDQQATNRGNTGRSTTSNAELKERIELTAHLLGQGLRKGEIKRELKARFKNRDGTPISARTCEAYLTRARRLLVEKSGVSKQEHARRSSWFYLSILWNPSASTAHKLRARENLDRLLGLDPPKQVELQGSRAAPVSMTISRFLELRRALATAAQLRTDCPSADSGL